MSSTDPSRSDDSAREAHHIWSNERLMSELQLSRPLLSRLFMGALSEHEQRRLAIAHIEADESFRSAVARCLKDFKVPDVDAMARYAGALAQPELGDLEQVRESILEVSRKLIPDVATLGEAFSFEDLMSLGPATQQLMCWTAAELFLERASRPETPPTRKSVDLYLALTIIDVVEILGGAALLERS